MKSINAGIMNGNYTHGKSKTTEYRSWQAMHQRCSKPSNPGFIYYGARGIKVCERWQSFENFIADMKEKPSLEYSLERIDVDGNYTPDNCVWSDNHKQALNRRVRSSNTTGYRGVNWDNTNTKYAAYIQSGTTKLNLGLFDDPEQAALSYDIAAIQLNGSLAKLNIIGDK